MSVFGDRLKELRSSRKLTLEQLGKELGLSKSSINMYERGEREPSFEILETIADCFNVDYNYLLGKTERSTPMEMKRPEKKHQAEKNKPTDRLIFTTKVFSESQNIRVGINRDSAVIVNNICLQTGLTASEIVNRMIAFCESRVEILPGFYYGSEGEDENSAED